MIGAHANGRPRRFGRRTLLGSLGIGAGFVALGGAGTLAITRATEERQAEKEAVLRGEGVLYVEMFSQLLERSLDHVTMVHELAAASHRKRVLHPGGQYPTADEHLAQLAREERAGIFQIATIDRDGQLVWSTVPGWRAVDLRDREHFKVHAEGLRTPFISEPLRGRASLRHSLQLTRPILGPDDSFLGVSVVSLDPNGLSNDLGLAPMRPDSRVLLIRSDGLVLSANDARGLSPGQRVGEGNLHRFMAQLTGVDLVFGSRTGAQRIVAWKQVPGWPAVLVHSAPRSIARERAELDVAGYWKTLTGGLAAYLGLGAAALTWDAARTARRHARDAELARKETSEMLRALPGAAYRVSLPEEGEPAWHEAQLAVAAITGRTYSETDARNPFDTLTDSEGLALRADFLRQIIASGEAVVEYNGFRPDKTLIRIREHARILPGNEIHERLIIGQLTDITAEQNLRAKAHAAAQMANLGEMATGLAHEINQPAAAIALAADIAVLELERLPGGPPETLRRGLEDIAEQAARLREVIKHFRDFSKPDTDALPLQSMRLEEVIAGARRIADGILAGAGVTLRVYLPDHPLIVRARRVPLEQVLVNVLINARDALLHQPRIARVVDLSAAADEGQGTVSIRIRDYGTGLAPEILPRIFEPFFTTKSFDKGTGLGLSIAHTTMQGLGGSISARNHPAGGAEFCMVLLAGDDPRVVQTESETSGSRVNPA